MRAALGRASIRGVVHKLGAGVAVFGLVAVGLFVAAPNGGALTAADRSGFVAARAKLERQIADRATQLARLEADLKGASALTAEDASLLSTRLTNETSSIDALAVAVTKVATWPELRADKMAMIRHDRVYAVMTPQVFQTIEAAAIATQVSMLQSEQASLLASVEAIVGEVGYKSAALHYRLFLRAMQRAASASAMVTTTVLAQLPGDFPRDTGVFVRANHELLSADVSVAHADYDANVIGLATGGYTGS